MRTTTVLATGFGFPECPRWHADALWVSDMHTGEVSRVDPVTGRVTVVATVPGSAAGTAWDADGQLLVVSMTDRAVYRARDDGVELFAGLRDFAAARANELEGDAHGGFYVGNVGFSLTKEEPRPTRLGHLDAAGMVREVAADLWCPNGMAVTDHGRTLVVAETHADRVTSFTIGPDGSLSERRTLLDLPSGTHPDGLDVDADGRVWVASMSDPVLRCHDPGTGSVVEEVRCSQPAWACRLGGTDRRTLFACTSSGLDVAALDARPGRVEVLDLGSARPDPRPGVQP